MDPIVGSIITKEEVLAYSDGPGKVQERYEYRILTCRVHGKEGISNRLIRILNDTKQYWYGPTRRWKSLCTEYGCWKSAPGGSRGKCSSHEEAVKCKYEDCTHNAWKNIDLCKIHIPQEVHDRMKAYKKSEKGKMAQSNYKKSEKGKMAQSNYKKSEKGKMAQSNYQKSEKGKVTNSNYQKSEKGKISSNNHQKTEKGKVRTSNYQKSEKGKATISNNRKSEKSKTTRREWWKHKYYTDPGFRLEHLFRARLAKELKDVKTKKADHSLTILDCTTAFFRNHIEKQFTDGMSWDNVGRKMVTKGERYVVIDHLQPCAWFDLTKPSHQRVCFHYRNLRPLWMDDNAIKGSKVPTDITDKILLDMIAKLSFTDKEEPFEEVPESDTEEPETEEENIDQNAEE